MNPTFLEALASLETAGGRKTIKGPAGEDSHNLYNIKDFTGKGFRAHDKAEGSNDAYRVYKSPAEATSDLIGLLSRKYPKALEATDARSFALALKAGGYATDPAYVEKFVGVHERLSGETGTPRVDGPTAVAGPVPAPTAQPRDLRALYEAAKGPRPPRARLTKTAAAAAAVASMDPLLTPPKGDTPEDWFTRSTDSSVEARAQAEAVEHQGIGDIAQAQFMSTLGGDALKAISRPEYEPDGTTPTEADLVGLTTEEADALRDASSKAERERLKFEFQDQRDRMAEAGKSGAGWAVAGMLLAGGPEGYLSGGVASLAMARTAWGSARMIEQGRRGAAAGSLAAENIGANLALTAAQDYMSPYVGIQDYVIGALGGGVSMALHSPRILGASRSLEADVQSKMLDDAMEERAANLAAARAQAGESATPEQVAKAADGIQAQRLKAALGDASATNSPDRHLIPMDLNDELFGDAPTPVPAASALDQFPTLGTTSAADELGLPPDAVNLPFNDQGVLSSNNVPRTVSDLPVGTESNLRAAWSDANPLAAPAKAKLRQAWGLDYERDVVTAPRGVSVGKNGGALQGAHMDVARWLQKTFLPDQRVILMDIDAAPDSLGNLGDAWMIGGDVNVVRVSAKHADWQSIMLHEFGHLIFDRNIRSVKPELRAGFEAAHQQWLRRYAGDVPGAGALDTVQRRGPSTGIMARHVLGHQSPEGFVASMMDVMAGVVSRLGKELLPVDRASKSFKAATAYWPNVQEFSAEQFSKYIEAALADALDWKPASIPRSVVAYFKTMWDQFADLFNRAKAQGILKPEQGVVDFFEGVRKSAKASVTRAERVAEGKDAWRGMAPAEPSAMQLTPPPIAPVTDAQIAAKYGIDVAAEATGAQQARVKAMIALYRKAELYPMPDAERLSALLASKPMEWARSTAAALLASKNPVARMAAAELLESSSGAAGRRTSASIQKWINERAFMGNSINEFQAHYKDWRNVNGGSLREDFFAGAKWEQFNRMVAEELENRHQGRTTAMPPAVRNAADVLTAGYERMRVAQQRLKTPGWAGLPETSHGYMPHRMSARRIRAMSPDQGRVLHSVLTEQFITIEGMDLSFADGLASRYIQTVKDRATTGRSAPIGVHNSEAADIVEEAAQSMGMSRDEANALAKRVLRGAPAHTRHRLRLDLTRQYEADGQPFQLLDLFETDQLTLLRNQSSRVSGETALVNHGVMGSAGLKLIREAMANYGTKDGKAENAALEAFDQVSAELLGSPFGTNRGLGMQRAMQFNSLASLGGVGFNQFAEFLNGAITLGTRNALAAVGSFGRLRAEIIALSKGQRVNNPIIGSLETYGAEFGTDQYKMVFPFDMPDRLNETFGADDLTAADRLLRGGVHLQGKLSLWRAITSAQQRGMAEQIVHKALRYIRDGKSDTALADMGIGAELAAGIRAELANAATFDARGKLTSFDITKLENKEAANAFVQAVHRGTQQIIQGTFIGETGRWAHSDFLKLMMQFRTFSLIAVEKQWNRQAGNYGTAKALGMLLGTMAFAAPIYMIRAGIQSLGRDDQDEYLAKQLRPDMIARATLNYVALSGLAGDLIDATSAVAGVETTGGRSGANKSFVGNVVAPAAGKIDDVWGALQNSKDGTDPHALIKELPFSRLPFLYPAVNSLRE
jgi:hypothetical protein